jgi:hypothetical protein
MVSLTLDFNDVRTFWQMFDTLCGDGFQLDEQHSAVTEALVDRLLTICDDFEVSSWLDDSSEVDYPERPAGTIEFPLHDDELATLWRFFERDPGTEEARDIWWNAMHAVQLGTLMSRGLDEYVESGMNVRQLAQLLLHRALSYAENSTPFDAVDLVYAPLAVHLLDCPSEHLGDDLSLALLVARGALACHPEATNDALERALATLEDETCAHNWCGLYHPLWLLNNPT